MTARKHRKKLKKRKMRQSCEFAKIGNEVEAENPPQPCSRRIEVNSQNAVAPKVLLQSRRGQKVEKVSSRSFLSDTKSQSLPNSELPHCTEQDRQQRTQAERSKTGQGNEKGRTLTSCQKLRQSTVEKSGTDYDIRHGYTSSRDCRR